MGTVTVSSPTRVWHALMTAMSLAVVGACSSDTWPLDPETTWPLEVSSAPAEAPSGATNADVIYSTPRVANGDAVRDRLRSSYPNALRELGNKRAVVLRLYINEAGEAEQIRVAESSGVPSVDEVALRVARAAEFTPATHHGEPEGAWWSWRIRWPLIVIDGIPRPDLADLRDVRDLSPRDVATFRVVHARDQNEGQTAYQEWGADALILITTVDGTPPQ